MKTKTAKKPKKSEPAVRLKDLKPKKAARAGGTSGANFVFCDGSVRFLSGK